jgi:hypothetical protein
MRTEDLKAATTELTTQESDLLTRRDALKAEMESASKSGDDVQSKLIRSSLQTELESLERLSLALGDQKARLTQLQQDDLRALNKREEFLNSYQNTIDRFGKTADAVRRTIIGWDRLYDKYEVVVDSRAPRQPQPPPPTPPARGSSPAPPPARTVGTPNGGTTTVSIPAPPALPPPPSETGTRQVYTSVYQGVWFLDPNGARTDKNISAAELQVTEKNGTITGTYKITYQMQAGPVTFLFAISGRADRAQPLVAGTLGQDNAYFALKPPSTADGSTMEVEMRSTTRRDILQPSTLVLRRN